MLDLLISMRHNGEHGYKKCGDVLVAMLAESDVWGSEERSFHTIIEHEDEILEAKLRAMVTLKNPYPKIIHPYCEMNQEGHITKRSRIQLDVEKLHPDIRNAVKDKNRQTSKIKRNMVKLKNH